MSAHDDDTMLNATRVGDLPPPSSSTFSNSEQTPVSGGTYSDILKSMEVSKHQQSMSMPASIQMQQSHPPLSLNQQPGQQENPMQSLHTQSTVYNGTMPQSAPIGSFMPPPSNDDDVNQGPLVNTLLPDPMFFAPAPVVKPKRRRHHRVSAPPPVKRAYPAPKLPMFDINKLKPAILVAAIVFALLSWGAPMVAKKLDWTVDVVTGKFTSSGLVVISMLTGGIYLGVSELMKRYQGLN